MNTYGERILKTLKQLNVMNLCEGSSCYAEIYAFSCEIEMLREYLSDIFKEAFVSTAEGVGLKNLEALWGADDSKTVEARRKAIYNRKRIRCDCVCTEEFENLFISLGCLAYVTIDDEEFSVTVDIYDYHNEVERAMLESQIPGLFPVGYTVNICYG